MLRSISLSFISQHQSIVQNILCSTRTMIDALTQQQNFSKTHTSKRHFIDSFCVCNYLYYCLYRLHWLVINSWKIHVIFINTRNNYYVLIRYLSLLHSYIFPDILMIFFLSHSINSFTETHLKVVYKKWSTVIPCDALCHQCHFLNKNTNIINRIWCSSAFTRFP